MDNDEHQPKGALQEKRTFGQKPKAQDDEIHGTGAKAEDVADEADGDDDARLDEGLEETFPASDPVSAKHIT